MAQKLYSDATKICNINATFVDSDYSQLLERYNQVATSNKVNIKSNEDAVELLIFIMILELEFISDHDVQFAIDKFINLDNDRLTSCAFSKSIMLEVKPEVLPKFLKALGFELEATTAEGYTLLALTGYLRSSVNFAMETDKKGILRLAAPLSSDMSMFVRALYVTNSYAIGKQAELHDFLTELWEDTLSIERLKQRPFAYTAEAIDITKDGVEDYETHMVVDKVQLKASADLDKINKAAEKMQKAKQKEEK